MQIWPAIDLRGGQCVRLQQGDYGRETVFGDDPAAMARHWVEQGAECLHLVDLDGARDGRPTNLPSIQAILAAVDVPCELGGGIRDDETVRALFTTGLSRLVVGTRALREPEWFRALCHEFPDRMVLGIDARDGHVATDGWLQTSGVSAISLAQQFADDPVAAIIYTDIGTDGMLCGPNLSAMQQMRDAVDIPVVASGGIHAVEDFRQLASLRLAGCVVGRALYERKFTLREALLAVEEERLAEDRL